jgi:hypothetical protein
MAAKADSGSYGTENAANPVDALDAGWDDVPESSSAPAAGTRPLASTPSRSSPPPKPKTRPALSGRPPQPALASVGTPSLRPVTAAPRPRSWRAAPPVVAESLRDEVREEDVSEEDVRHETFTSARPRAEDVNAAPSESSVVPVASLGPVVSSSVDFPKVRERKSARRIFAAVVAVAAALAGASVAVHRFAAPNPASSAVVTRSPEENAAARAPERPTPEPVSPPVVPVSNEAVPPPVPANQEAAATPPATSATTVTIKTIPEGAVIFRARQRLGAGVVEVSVERNTKQRFTALLDGYTPSNFTLDGSRDSITIRLKRAPKREAAPAAESTAPNAAEPNVDSSSPSVPEPASAAVATAPASTNAPATTTAPVEPTPPAPESIPPAAPNPGVSAPAASE